MLQLRTEGANQRFSSNKVQALNKPGVGVISSKINVLGRSTTKDPREEGKTISFIKYEEDNKSHQKIKPKPIQMYSVGVLLEMSVCAI